MKLFALYCIVLQYGIGYEIILYCIVLHYSMRNYIVLYGLMRHCIGFYCSIRVRP